MRKCSRSISEGENIIYKFNWLLSKLRSEGDGIVKVAGNRYIRTYIDRRQAKVAHRVPSGPYLKSVSGMQGTRAGGA